MRIRDFLQTLFDDEGYHTAIVAGGEQMRAALAKDCFDVALIGVTLPGADDGFAPRRRLGPRPLDVACPGRLSC